MATSLRSAPRGVLSGRAALCARGRRPAREPSALRAFGSARRLEARPGPATAHGHRSQALTPPTGTATRQRWRALWCPMENVADRCPWLHGLSHLRWHAPAPLRRSSAALGSGATCLRQYAKSPQPLRVCGLAWNSGVTGIRSVAVGLHQVLGVGELVELIDVGLGNHDVDGREHE